MAGALTIVTREQWGARAQTHQASGAHIEKLRGLAVHHSGTPGDRQDRHQDCAAKVQAAQHYHQVSKGWSDIAYHWLVCWHGSLYIGRSLTLQSAAQGSDYGNDRYFAVCVLGLWGRETLPSTVTQALTEARRRLLTISPRARRCFPHSSFFPTDCPGVSLSKWASATNVET